MASIMAALAGSALAILHKIGSILIGVLVFVLVTAVFMGVLPDDPFRPAIASFASMVAPYGAIIGTFIPVKFIASSTAFVVATKYFIWIYRKLYGVVLETSSGDAVDV